ncbi:hypothetical protein [Phytohalomonas tamaricis]|uniref:hypothetical protein n=1 Tax=Phytohalomonas tamaricis TaxID=2081032 RepID=UPI000D0B59CE|nr:hypothetical protein [Phytohalomonas tamaricis]
MLTQHGLNVNGKAMSRIKGNPLGTRHDTYDDWWRLLGTHVRQPPGTASVHGSVWTRWEDDASYRPENLSKR